MTIPVIVTTPPVIHAPLTAEFAFGIGGSIPVTVTPEFPTTTTLNVVGPRLHSDARPASAASR